MNQTTGIMPLPIAANCSVGNDTGWPFVHHCEMPRQIRNIPKVAMNGGIRVNAIKLPFIAPITAPKTSPTITGTMTGRSNAHAPKTAFGLSCPLTNSVCAKDMTIIAAAPTSGPDDKSIPPETIT